MLPFVIVKTDSDNFNTLIANKNKFIQILNLSF